MKSTLITREELLTLVAAMMHEPSITDSGVYQYIFGTPPTFPKYIDYFCPPFLRSEKITVGPPILTCSGLDRTSARTYLAVEGKHQCSKCTTIFCKTCGFIPSNKDKKIIYKIDKKKKLCFACYKQTAFDTTDNKCILTVAEMKQSLKDMHQEVDNIANPHKILKTSTMLP